MNGQMPFCFYETYETSFIGKRLRDLYLYFLDDSWLWGTSKVACSNNFLATRKLLFSVGLGINNGKPGLDPVQLILHLGFMVDSL